MSERIALLIGAFVFLILWLPEPPRSRSSLVYGGLAAACLVAALFLILK